MAKCNKCGTIFSGYDECPSKNCQSKSIIEFRMRQRFHRVGLPVESLSDEPINVMAVDSELKPGEN